jgi:membrane associated rhomboid family serine protease
LIDILKVESYRKIYSIGYSGIIFGWMSLASVMFVGKSFFGIPNWLMPYFSLIVTQLIVPQASFLGHFSGIISGYFVFYGFFEW